jgi:asparagine synthase (glutamine-hydrolysing)
MAEAEGRVQIVYNGEVYNFHDIRDRLEKLGHDFQSRTDTEVILKSYIQWGIDCIQEFVGMFALAIWDGRSNRLFCARDRLGIKPLFYHYTRGSFFFASELKALMAFKTFQRELDLEAVLLFLHYQYVPAPKTIFKNTFKLLPAHYAVLDRNDLKIRPYWERPGNAPCWDFGEDETLDRLDALLNRSVSDRLVSDVPLGAMLSGGIDSSLVVALMQKINKSPVRTFSIGFQDAGFDEAPWAKRVARHLGSEHTEFYVTPKEALEIIPLLPEIYDEPFADPSAIPTHLVSRLARTQVTVALSGDGGDEQFCGYVRYWSTRAMATSFRKFPEQIRKLMALLLQRLPVKWVEKCYLPLRDRLPQRFQLANFQDKWRKLQLLMASDGELADLYRMTICLWQTDEIQALTGKRLVETPYEEMFRRDSEDSLLSRLMYVDQKTYLPDAMLTKVDRASMAVGLEVRVPLLDHRVVEFTSSLPDHFKYRDGKGKHILKKLLARYLPPELFERPKMGFAIPYDLWLRQDLKRLLRDHLSARRLREEGLFDPRLVEKMLVEHFSGHMNYKDRLWALLMWEMWRERWMRGNIIGQ